MPKVRLSAPYIENLKPPTSGRAEYWDSVVSDDVSLPGSFGLRVTSNGIKSWVIMYRVRRSQRRMTVGRYPAYSLSEARGIAREALKSAGRGIDPATQHSEEVAPVLNVSATIDAFIKRYAKPRNRSWKESERILRHYLLPACDGNAIETVTPATVHKILDGLVDAGHPIMANRTYAAIRKFFNWCVERGYVDASPVAGISKPAPEMARDRVLDPSETRSVWAAADKLGWPFGPLVKVLLLTAQRRSEVARMRWEHVDLDACLWSIPSSETKSNRQHDVPLSAPVIDVLENLPREHAWVFSTTGTTPVSGFTLAKRRLDKLSGTSGWTLHDLRRTAASGMAELGIAPHIVERILNHRSGEITGVAAIYNRYSYLKERHDALEAWASRVIEIGNA